MVTNVQYEWFGDIIPISLLVFNSENFIKELEQWNSKAMEGKEIIGTSFPVHVLEAGIDFEVAKNTFANRFQNSMAVMQSHACIVMDMSGKLIGIVPRIDSKIKVIQTQCQDIYNRYVRWNKPSSYECLLRDSLTAEMIRHETDSILNKLTPEEESLRNLKRVFKEIAIPEDVTYDVFNIPVRGDTGESIVEWRMKVYPQEEEEKKQHHQEDVVMQNDDTTTTTTTTTTIPIEEDVFPIKSSSSSSSSSS